MLNTASDRRSHWRALLGRVLVPVLVLTLSMGCGLFCDRSELRESKRVAECRQDARRACHRLAKEDESIDVDECVSERSWQCALGNPETPETATNDS